MFDANEKLPFELKDVEPIYDDLIRYAKSIVGKCTFLLQTAEGGQHKEDIVHDLVLDSIIGALDGDREWNRKEYPTLKKFLFSVIDSNLSHIFDSYEYEFVHRMAGAGEKKEGGFISEEEMTLGTTGAPNRHVLEYWSPPDKKDAKRFKRACNATKKSDPTPWMPESPLDEATKNELRDRMIEAVKDDAEALEILMYILKECDEDRPDIGKVAERLGKSRAEIYNINKRLSRALDHLQE